MPLITFLLVGLALVIVARSIPRGGGRSPTSGGPEQFAATWRISLTAASTDPIRNYLVAARRWRRGGSAFGAIVGIAVGVWSLGGIVRPLIAGLIVAVVGYFLGTFLAELRIQLRQPDTEKRTAELRPRNRREYLDASMFGAICAAPIVGIALFVIRLATHRSDPFQWPLALALLLMMLVVLGMLALGMRRIVRRPRPSGEPDVVAACDAIAAHSAQALVSAGGCVAFWLLAWESIATVTATPLVAALSIWLCIVAFGLALRFWVRRNRVARPATPEPAA